MPSAAVLDRQTFSTSRELEYFSESELTTQTGYGREDWWPGVIVKELADNALDVCEQAGTPPRIEVAFHGDSLEVTDNGPGLKPETVASILDFSTKTSDKAAYVSPTRGAQGNALKTILAIPYVLSEGQGGHVEIESLGIRHTISVSTNHVLQRPQIDHRQEPIVRNSGTLVRVTLDAASENDDEQEPGFLQNLIADFALFNPHASFELLNDGDRTGLNATSPEWRKWLPTDPTSAHWYDVERLETLIGCCIGAEQAGGRVRSVREFIAEFRGLLGSGKQKQVSERAGLQRALLHDLVTGNHFDHGAVEKLLDAMQELSAPVKPELLGVLGREHFAERLQPEGDTLRYVCRKAIDPRGLPCLIECAFAVTAKDGFRGLRAGINWSVPLGNPLQSDDFRIGDSHVSGLSGLLSNQRISFDSDPVCLAIHLACPRFRYLDRGKGSVSLDGDDIRGQLSDAVLAVTREWTGIKKKEDRDRRADSERSRYWRGVQEDRITVKSAAWDVMRDAYSSASGNGRYPANARQIMYAARPAIQACTCETLKDVYFTQTLLPDYIREHPQETAGWDVVYDARGHLSEPHTREKIGVGTIEVRNYLRDSKFPQDLSIQAPRLNRTFPTSGPRNRYGAVLYIEKEGFLPLLEQARFAERYDLALMSSKGMGTVAARSLIESLAGSTKILVLHDFDKSGFSIAGTLTRDTRRYEFSTTVEVIDLGLRLVDVEKWDLQSENVHYDKSDPTENLRENGATPHEIAFLYHGDRQGARVELNAFTSDQFVAWLDSKLIEHGVAKVIPDEQTLEQAYRRAVAVRRWQSIIDAAGDEVSAYARDIPIPQGLREALAGQLTLDPASAWDDALSDLAAIQTKETEK